jgi:hypothetical protein
MGQSYRADGLLTACRRIEASRTRGEGATQSEIPGYRSKDSGAARRSDGYVCKAAGRTPGEPGASPQGDLASRKVR